VKDNSQSPSVRIAAVAALGTAGSNRAVQALIPLLDADTLSSDRTAGQLRWAAIEALGTSRDQEAVEPLVGQLCKQPAISIATSLKQLGWRPSRDEERVCFALAMSDYQSLIEMEWTDGGGPAISHLTSQLSHTRLESLSSSDRAMIIALGNSGVQEAVEPLVQFLLKAPHLDVVQSLKALGWIPSSAVERVCVAVANRDEKMGGEAALPVVQLLRLLGRGSEVAIWVESRLPRCGESFRDSIFEMLSAETDYRVRSTIILIVGLLQDERAKGPLLSFLGDRDKDVRASAATAFETTIVPEAADPLRRLLRDKEQWVRMRSAEALSSYPSPETMAALRDTILNRIRENSRYECSAYFNTLASFGADATPCLVELLGATHAECRELAVSTLGRIRDPNSIATLIEAVKLRPREVHFSTLVNLGTLVVEPLISLLNDASSSGSLEVVISALGRIGDDRARNPIFDLLSNSTASVFSGWRKTATEALVILDDARAVPYVVKWHCSISGRTRWAHDFMQKYGLESIPPLLTALSLKALSEPVKSGLRDKTELFVEWLSGAVADNLSVLSESVLRELMSLEDGIQNLWRDSDLDNASWSKGELVGERKVSCHEIRQMAKDELEKRGPDFSPRPDS
jgi:HEAT repeat protein